MKLNKLIRVLKIYDRLKEEKFVNKNSLSIELGVDTRTIERYLNELKDYIYEKDGSTLAYNKDTQSYKILK